MEFRIADTFTSSLAKLTGEEQRSAKTTAFDLQLNPASPGMQFHKLDRAKDKHFWSVRVNRDVRIIVHRTNASLLLCYVDHHDKAYEWAERRKLEVHPNTGAAQMVEIRETIREIEVPVHVAVAESTAQKSARLLFAGTPDETLLGYGVPAEWLADVRASTEDSLFDVVEHLPAEASEALLALAVGETPLLSAVSTEHADPFEHPDAQRRFRVVRDVEELARALDAPWETWTVFLHPSQRSVVERQFAGPARVTGSAGTGKTVVALHRAVELARQHEDARVLLTTFSDRLAKSLERKLLHLIGRDLGRQPQLAERIEVGALDTVALRIHERRLGKVSLASESLLREVIAAAAVDDPDVRVSHAFLEAEWHDVIDAWQLESWEAYRDVARLGRKTRLPEKQRAALWLVFERVRNELRARGVVTIAQVYAGLTNDLEASIRQPFEFIVVDEAQDLSVPQLRFLAAAAKGRPDALFFAGDLGQRIFRTAFSWLSLGVDIRGRSHTLRVNYRTSHQIRSIADRLLDEEVQDVDGVRDRRAGTVSVFDGPEPTVRVFDSEESEAAGVAKFIQHALDDEISAGEIAVFVRSAAELPRAQRALMTVTELNVSVAVLQMHDAKGLEFKAVAVMACDDEVLPLQSRIDAIGDPADLEEVYETERNLLYVACTRARDRLWVSGVRPASEFLGDLFA